MMYKVITSVTSLLTKDAENGYHTCRMLLFLLMDMDDPKMFGMDCIMLIANIINLTSTNTHNKLSVPDG
jgi:hypothetical protein